MAKALDFILEVMGSSCWHLSRRETWSRLRQSKKRGRRGRGGGREAGWEATANLKVVQV